MAKDNYEIRQIQCPLLITLSNYTFLPSQGAVQKAAPMAVPMAARMAVPMAVSMAVPMAASMVFSKAG